LKTDVLRNFHTIKIVIELNSENNCSLYMVTAVILNLKTIHVSFVPWNAIVSRMSQEVLILPKAWFHFCFFFITFMFVLILYPDHFFTCIYVRTWLAYVRIRASMKFMLQESHQYLTVLSFLLILYYVCKYLEVFYWILNLRCLSYQYAYIHTYKPT
jgi:hypothetical protein